MIRFQGKSGGTRPSLKMGGVIPCVPLQLNSDPLLKFDKHNHGCVADAAVDNWLNEVMAIKVSDTINPADAQRDGSLS